MPDWAGVIAGLRNASDGFFMRWHGGAGGKPKSSMRGYPHETFETFNAAFIVRTEIQVPIDCEPVPLPRMLIERHPESFCVHDYEFRDDGEPGDGPLAERKSLGGFYPARAEEAWDSFSHCLDCQNVSVFVGPGSSPVVLEGAVADPRYFQVWNADATGTTTFIGQSVHRLIAMGMAKQVVASGGCPVVMSHYLEPDHEWECESIEELPESSKPAESSEGCTSSGNESLEHLLDLAQRGKLSEASGAEKQSRRIVTCLLNNVLGLDRCASAGIGVLVDCVHRSPMDGRRAIREAIR